MAVFDLENFDIGSWFEYDDEGARVCVRAYSDETMTKIREEASSKKVEYKKVGKRGGLQRFEYIDFDEAKMKELLWDYAIVDWQGFYQPGGEEIDCTKENKILLMKKIPKFFAFIDKCLEILIPETDARMEDIEKN